MMLRVCSWCRWPLGLKRGRAGVTHGICRPCASLITRGGGRHGKASGEPDVAAHDGSHPSRHARATADPSVLMLLCASLAVTSTLVLGTAVVQSVELRDVTAATLQRAQMRRSNDPPVTNTNLQHWSAAMRFEVMPR